MNKQKLKRLSKRSLSVLLTILMVLSMLTVLGTATASAASTDYYLTGYLHTSGSYSDVTKDNATLMFTSDGNGTYSLTTTFTGGDAQYVTVNYGQSTKYYDVNGGNTENNPATLKEDTAYNASTSGKVKVSMTTSTTVTFTWNPASLQLSYAYGDAPKPQEPVYVTTKLFNYLYENQLNNGATDDTSNNTTGDTNDAGGTWSSYRSKNGIANSSLNTAISNYFKTELGGSTTAARPLYFGTFWEETSGGASYVNSSLLNPYMSPNSAHRPTTGTNMNAVAQGLVDTSLNSDGELTQNGVVLPYFSESWFASHKASGNKDLAHIYDTSFPMNVTLDSTTGISKYSYDSKTDANRYFDASSPEQMKTDGTGLKNFSDTSTGYFAFSKNEAQRKYSFGTQFDIDFYVTEDGKIVGEDDASHPMQFDFSGDDDVWVYIDGKLALDMGGAHKAATGSLDFSTGTSTYAQAFDGTSSTSTNSTTGPAVTSNKAVDFSSELLTALGGTKNGNTVTYKNTGKAHKLTFYYMERGFLDSNMSISYNLLKEPQVVGTTVTNDINTNTVNKGLLAGTLKVADNDGFTYAVNANRSSGEINPVTANTSDLVRNNTLTGNNTVLSKNGNPTGGIEFAADGTVTPVTNVLFQWNDFWNGSPETTVSGTGKTTTTANAPLTLLYNQSANFQNLFAIDDAAGVRSTVQIGQNNDLALADRTGNELSFGTGSRKVSDYYTTDWKLLPEGKTTSSTEGTADYATNNTAYVTDNKVADSFYNAGTVNENTANYVAEFINTVKTKDIIVKKEFAAGDTADANAKFEFRVAFDGIFGGATTDTYTEYAGLTYSINGGAAQTYNTATGIQLGQNDVATISGVPVGTKYKITEVGKVEGSSTTTYSFVNVQNISDTQAMHATTVKVTGENAVTGNFSIGTTEATTNDYVSFVNTSKSDTFTVTYKYHPRLVVNGVPTVIDNNNYKTFTKKVKALTNDAIKAAAPTIGNVLDAYNLTDGDIVIDSANGTAVATYTNAPKTYNVNYIIEGNTKTVSKEFNALVTAADDVNAGNQSTDGRKFMYWALLRYTDPASGVRVWTPVTDQYNYMYRVTGNINLMAVYEGDTDPVTGGQFQNLVTKFSDYSSLGINATSSQTAYDFYTTADGVNRVRANVIFGSVGNKDVDEGITKVGYVRINNKESYSTEFTSKNVYDAIKANNMTALKPAGAGGADATKIEYTVDTHYGPDATDYPAGHIALTNKNRANFVFDMQSKDTNMNKYYTVYTYMYKNGVLYVSDSAAYINLSEAISGITDPQKVVTTSVKTTDDKTLACGTLTADKLAVDVDGTITFTAKAAASVVVDGKTYYPVFDHMTINGQNYTDATVSYSVTADAPATINAVAYFKLDTTRKITITTTSTGGDDNCTALITKLNGADITPVTTLTVNSDDNVTVTATPSEHYSFASWSDAGEAEHTFTAVDNATLTATFTKKLYTVSVESPVAGGTATVNGSASVSVAYGTTVNLTATADTGYEFTQWNDGNTSATRNVQVTGDTIYTPTFAKQRVTISVPATITGGTATVSDGTATVTSVTVDYGTQVTLKATADSGYTFKSWNDSDTNATRTVTATASVTYTPTFATDGATYYFAVNKNVTTDPTKMRMGWSTNTCTDFTYLGTDSSGTYYMYSAVISGLGEFKLASTDGISPEWIGNSNGKLSDTKNCNSISSPSGSDQRGNVAYVQCSYNPDTKVVS